MHRQMKTKRFEKERKFADALRVRRVVNAVDARADAGGFFIIKNKKSRTFVGTTFLYTYFCFSLIYFFW